MLAIWSASSRLLPDCRPDRGALAAGDATGMTGSVGGRVAGPGSDGQPMRNRLLHAEVRGAGAGAGARSGWLRDGGGGAGGEPHSSPSGLPQPDDSSGDESSSAFDPSAGATSTRVSRTG